MKSRLTRIWFISRSARYIDKMEMEIKKYRMQVVNSLYCSSSSFEEEGLDLEHNEIQGMEPYQFEPELTNDEPNTYTYKHSVST